MIRDFRSFLEHERNVLRNNIARQKRGLEWYKNGDPMAQGHIRMLEIEKRHLAMFDTLLQGEVDPEMTLLTCREALRMAEDKHRRVIVQGQKNDDMWWETLDVIQFLSELIYRIENWENGTKPEDALPDTAVGQ